MEFQFKSELNIKEEELSSKPSSAPIKSSKESAEESAEPTTFDGRWSSDGDSRDEGFSDSNKEDIRKDANSKKQVVQKKTQKIQSYCDGFWRSETKKLLVKLEPKLETWTEPTFDGKWSSDEEVSDGFPDSEDETLMSMIRQKRREKKAEHRERLTNPNAVGPRDSFWSHKKNSLTGKFACKYCETMFRSRIEQSMHECKYLKCNPKNFICRVCGKELSRKSFSNHLHETLDCQFCKKKFVNPRSMKTHLQKQHKGQEIAPPKTLKDVFKKAERRNTLKEAKATDHGENKNKSEPTSLEDKPKYECGKKRK